MQPQLRPIAAPENETMVPAMPMEARPLSFKAAPPATNNIDVIAAIKKRPYLMFAVLFLCLGIGIPYIVRHQGHEYHAEASIYVSPTYIKNIRDDREQLQISYSTLVNQQILTIHRYDILKAALQRLEEEGIHWRAPNETERAAIERLAQQLEVQPIPDSYEIAVGLNSSKREWVAPIVNTIAETYLEKSRGEDNSERLARLDALHAEQASVARELNQKLHEQADLSRGLMVSNLDKATPTDDQLLASTREALEDARRKRLEAEAQLAMLAGDGNGTSKPALAALAEESVKSDVAVGSLTSKLLERRLELRTRLEALKQEGLLPAHPKVLVLEKELADVNDQLTRAPQGATEQASGRLLAKVRADVERSRLLETKLAQEVASQASNVQVVAKKVQEARGVNDDLERLRRHQSIVESRIEDLTLQGNEPGFLRVFAQAQEPLGPVKNNYKKPLIILFGIAMLLSVAAPVGMDLVKQTLLHPSEITRVLGFPPLGIAIEEWDPAQRAFAEEHFRRLINGIQRAVLVRRAKSIVFTPIKHARTPENLVADIARGLIARGMKPVIIDANTGCGKERRASSLKGLIAMLEELGQGHDVVLIDGPPLQFSADMELFASVSDISLIVAEAGKATRADLVKAAALLERLDAPSMGVIMSHVRLRRAGGLLKRDFKQFSSVLWSQSVRS